MRPALHAWMNGELVGRWYYTRTGAAAFQYADTWLNSAATRPLSLSIPLTANQEIRGAVVDNYFDNLLPDSVAIRRRLALRFKAASAQAFDLLAAIGRDCVGAVQLLPEDETPTRWQRIDAQALSEAEIEHQLQAMVAAPALGQHDDLYELRISVAGAQEKTALLQMGGRWFLPLHSTPTTHLIKLPMGLVGNMQADMSSSVENEWLCAQILSELGLPVAQTTMQSFGSQRALVVKRFDRRWQGVDDNDVARKRFEPKAGVWIARLPQEDFCQAMGLPSAMKYESDGGPRIDDGLKLLAASETAAQDRSQFVLAQFVFWLLAATDGHAKNFSLFHQRGATFRMTPLYDVMSAWPIVGNGANQLPYRRAKLAMALRGKNVHYHLDRIRVRHWQELIKQAGQPALWAQFVALAAGVKTTLAQVEAKLPERFPRKLWQSISQGLRRHAEQFLAEAKTEGLR